MERLTKREEIEKEKLVQLLLSPNEEMARDLLSEERDEQEEAIKRLISRLDLIRLMELKESVKKLEDTYIERAIEDREAMDLKSLSRVIEVVNKSIGNLKEERDKRKGKETIVNTTNQQVNQVINQNLTVNLPVESRNKIRGLVEELLKSGGEEE